MDVIVTFDIDKMSDYPSLERVGIVGSSNDSGAWRPQYVGVARYKKLNKWQLQLALPTDRRFVFRPFLYYLPTLTVTLIGRRLRYADVGSQPLTVHVQCPYVMAGPDTQPRKPPRKYEGDDDLYNAEHGILAGSRFVTILEPKNQVRSRDATRRRDRQIADESTSHVEVETLGDVALDGCIDGHTMTLVPYSDALDIWRTPYRLVGIPLTRQGERALVQQIIEIVKPPAEKTQPGIEIVGDDPGETVSPIHAEDVPDVLPRLGNKGPGQLNGHTNGNQVPRLATNGASEGKQSSRQPHSITGGNQTSQKPVPFQLPRQPVVLQDPSQPHICRLCDGRNKLEELAKKMLKEKNQEEELKDQYRIEYVEVDGRLDVHFEKPSNELRRIKEIHDKQKEIFEKYHYAETHKSMSTMTEPDADVQEDPGDGLADMVKYLTKHSNDDRKAQVVANVGNGIGYTIEPDMVTDLAKLDNGDRRTEVVANGGNDVGHHTIEPVMDMAPDVSTSYINSHVIVAVGIGAAILAAFCYFKSK